jgi:hypothetical protein
MKTNVIMIRSTSGIKFPIYQRISDGKFNLTEIVKEYNRQYGKQKDLKEFISNKSTLEFAETIVKREIPNGGNSPYLEVLDNHGYSSYVLQATRGKYGGTWAHPLLFLDGMMWLSPDFKYDALKMVQDKLIQFRHSSGDKYLDMTPAIDTWYRRNNNGKETPKETYAQFATLIKFVVFGRMVQHSMWQKCSEDDLELRHALEKTIIQCCNDNLSMEDIMERLIFVKQLRLN